ncbi:hypothetical protein C9374_002718 [Naegleria lovaniensis]|uniref:Uncharacterized protein n=1 Tax=Naegleria lovaniensis TaxID=51637 RepID=A0AA88GP58_NAELO|nr:uncharacterized protein C9374_002718 [Naegleria lovaniensis]KAG2386272.1 hypothetical protein C9374_002718 [Naegleria lovaniensis]
MITTVQARFRTENTLASVNMTCLILSGEHRSLVDSSETVMNVGNEQKDDHSEMMKVKSKAIHDREPQFKTNKKSQSKNHQSLVHAVNKEIMTVFPNNKECKHNPTLMYKKTTETAATPKDEPSLSSDSTPNQTRTTLSGALSLMRHDIYRRNEEFYDTQLLMLEKDDADSKLSMVETEGEMNGVYSEHENSLIEHSKLSQAVLNEQEVEELFLRRERLKEMDQQIQELKQQERTLKERSKHKIDLLHKYNKIKDICQFLIEKLALIENRTVTSIYEEYNLENED